MIRRRNGVSEKRRDKRYQQSDGRRRGMRKAEQRRGKENR